MFYQDQFRGFGAPGSRNLPFPITVAIGLYNSLCYRTSRDYWNPRDMIEDIVRRTVQFVTLGVFMCMLHIPFVFASVCVQYLHHHISSCCFSPSRWTKYCGQRILCMSVCLSVCLLTCLSEIKPRPNFTNVPYMLPVAMTRSTSDGSSVRYVLPVLWMTPFFHMMERMGPNEITSSSPGFSTGGEVCHLWLHLVFIEYHNEWCVLVAWVVTGTLYIFCHCIYLCASVYFSITLCYTDSDGDRLCSVWRM